MKTKILIFGDGFLTECPNMFHINSFFSRKGLDFVSPFGRLILLEKFMSIQDKADTYKNVITSIVNSNKPDIVIGINLSACYVEMLRDCMVKILINPLLDVDGMNIPIEKKNFWNRKACLRAPDYFTNLKDSLFRNITDYEREHTFAFFGGNDEQERSCGLYLQHYPNVVNLPIADNICFEDVAQTVLDIIEL